MICSFGFSPYVDRLATKVIVLAHLTFMMTQQMTRKICNPELVRIFARLEKK